MWKREKTEHGTESSIGNVTENIFGGNVGNIIAGIDIDADIVRENSPEESSIQQISDMEWMELAKFFLEKQLSSDVMDQKLTEQYAKAEELVKKKDKEGLKNFFGNAGRSIFKIALGAGAQVGIKGIINKVMK